MPLPELIPMIKGVPADVLDAARRLACSTCVRRRRRARRHSRLDDEDMCFSRVGFPHMLCAQNAPEGMGSIQAEVYFSSKYRPFTGKPEDWIEPVIHDLRRCGLLREEDEILTRKAVLLKYANIIFDLERAEAVRLFLDDLDEIGLSDRGRYGEWGYLWTDESFKSGENAAERAIANSSAVTEQWSAHQAALRQGLAQNP